MPDIRLRPSGLPGDLALVPGERSPVEIRLGAGASPSVVLVRALSGIETSARYASLTATGGGVAVVLASTSRARGVGATGGGGGIIAASGGRSVSLAATGGGEAHAVASASRSGEVMGSGGGSLDHGWTGAHAMSLSATGGGRSTVAGTSVVRSEFPPLASYRPVFIIRGRGSFRATGGGRARITGEGWWNDDDLVLELLDVA